MAYNHEKPQYDEKGIYGIKGTDENLDTYNIKGDKIKGTINVAQYVWDTNLMEWVKLTVSTDQGASIYNDTRLAYLNDRDIEYIGRHEESGASESDTTWSIVKVYYDTNYNVTRTQVATGAWSSRTELF